ncbi:MAG: hypothetical protein JRJ17_01480, partial [Deltaproteobacteria bacterium]|nr:hypothetical protein [Deltaproteobacteria bacterium]
MSRRILIWMGIFVTLSLASFAIAGEGRLQFVETEVNLFPDGRASVEYVVRYTVISGEFHGFYFEGFDRLTPIFDRNNASAIDSRGNTYGLDIKKVSSDKYDIVLANGIGVSSGYVTYRFRFAAGMSEAGYLASTTAAEGRKLIVFNWSPTEWDQPLEHYTVKVVYPIQYTSPQTDRSSIEAELLTRGFATERFMNQEYKIDYRLRKVGGEQHIEVLLHKEKARTKYHFRIQQYVDADVFPEMRAVAATPRGPSRPGQQTSSPGRGISAKDRKIPSRWILGIGVIITLLMGIFGVSRKHRSMVRAQSELDMVKWVREDWEPPKIELASFRKKGKIAKDLNPIEAGVFIGV